MKKLLFLFIFFTNIISLFGQMPMGNFDNSFVCIGENSIERIRFTSGKMIYSSNKMPTQTLIELGDCDISFSCKVKFAGATPIYEILKDKEGLSVKNSDKTIQIFRYIGATGTDFSICEDYYSINKNGVVEYLNFFFLLNEIAIEYRSSTQKNGILLKIISTQINKSDTTYKVSFPNETAVYTLKVPKELEKSIFCISPDNKKQIFKKL